MVGALAEGRVCSHDKHPADRTAITRLVLRIPGARPSGGQEVKRQAPKRPEDSGWTFEGAAEDRAALSTAAGWSVAHLDTVVKLEPKVAALLDAAEGTVFLLDHDGEYKKLAPAAARAFLD